MKKIKSFFSKIGKFFAKNTVALCVIIGILLMSMTVRTHSIFVKYYEYSVRIDFSIYGYSIRAVPQLDNSQDIVKETVLVGKSHKQAVIDASRTILKKYNNGWSWIRVKVTGYSFNNTKLEEDLVKALHDEDIMAGQFIG